jgi:hypothetical protein
MSVKILKFWVNKSALSDPSFVNCGQADSRIDRPHDYESTIFLSVWGGPESLGIFVSSPLVSITPLYCGHRRLPIWPIVHNPMIEWLMMMIFWSNWWNEFGRGNWSTRRKPVPAPLCPPQNPTWRPGLEPRTAVVGSQRLTAWGEYNFLLYMSVCVFLVRGFPMSRSMGRCVRWDSTVHAWSQLFDSSQTRRGSSVTVVTQTRDPGDNNCERCGCVLEVSSSIPHGVSLG